MKTNAQLWDDIGSLTTMELDYLKGQIQAEIKRRYAAAGKGTNEKPSPNEAEQVRHMERKPEAMGDDKWLAP